MVTALNPKKRTVYVCKEDRGSDNPTRWTLRPMTIFDRAEVEQLLKGDADSRAIGRLAQLVRMCVTGCQGLRTADGEEVPFVLGEDGYATKDFVACIPEDVIVELFNVICEREEVKPEEAGKSDSGGSRGDGDAEREVPEMSGAEPT